MSSVATSRTSTTDAPAASAVVVSPAAAASVYQLKITLKHSKPPIWRRVQVLDSDSLLDLHDTIQSVIRYFGDNWNHDIVLEQVTPLGDTSVNNFPVCLAAKRTGPIEDSGGIGGYCYKMAAIENPNHPDNKYTVRWLEDVTGIRTYDPVKVDLAQLNQALKNVAPTAAC